MRLKSMILASVLVPSALAPLALMPTAASAQDTSVNGRIDRLEQEVRALQRKVFPGGSDRYFEPEIQAQQQPSRVPGTSTDASAVTNLMTRVDALEAQLASLTGQVEERGYQMRQMETKLSALQDRIARLESAPPPLPRWKMRRTRLPLPRQRPSPPLQPSRLPSPTPAARRP